MEKFLLKDDKRKQDYYHKFAGGVWNDATNYDLWPNSGKLGFEKCVDAIEAQLKIMLGKIKASWGGVFKTPSPFFFFAFMHILKGVQGRQGRYEKIFFRDSCCTSIAHGNCLVCRKRTGGCTDDRK